MERIISPPATRKLAATWLARKGAAEYECCCRLTRFWAATSQLVTLHLALPFGVVLRLCICLSDGVVLRVAVGLGALQEG